MVRNYLIIAHPFLFLGETCNNTGFELACIFSWAFAKTPLLQKSYIFFLYWLCGLKMVSASLFRPYPSFLFLLVVVLASLSKVAVAASSSSNNNDDDVIQVKAPVVTESLYDESMPLLFGTYVCESEAKCVCCRIYRTAPYHLIVYVLYILYRIVHSYTYSMDIDARMLLLLLLRTVPCSCNPFW